MVLALEAPGIYDVSVEADDRRPAEVLSVPIRVDELTEREVLLEKL